MQYRKTAKRRIHMVLVCMALALPATPAVSAETPCATLEHSQFDFWLGDWQVYRPGGQLAGSNRIEKILDGCVVFENWKSASVNFAGKSFNTWDPLTKTWNQVWVDTTGATIKFSGVRSGDIMLLTGTHASAAGTVHYRMSYTLNGDQTVRQLWEQSADRQTWEVIFDGLYRK